MAKEETRTKSEISIKIPMEIRSNLEFCIKYHTPDFTYHIDSFLYIIHTIRNLSTYNKFKNLQKVPIYSKILRFEIGKHYRRYLDYLLKYKFITTDNHYIVGDSTTRGKCKCYGIGNKYRKNKSETYILSKKSILRKVIKWKEDKLGSMVNDELLGHLYDMIKKIDIDMGGAKQYLDKMVEEKVINSYQASLEWDKCKRIHDKDDPYALFVKKDAYGRVHSNFTNISKFIREKFLYLDGERLVGLDIISSQPALLGTLFRDYFEKTINDFETHINDPFHMTKMDLNMPIDIRDKYVNNRNKYTGDHMYVNEFSPLRSDLGYSSTLDMLEVATGELKKYENILEIGLYEFFQSHWEELFADITRQEIKKEWVSYVFGQKNSPFHESMDIIWKKEFPLLRKALMHFKTGSHKLLAHELQRREANIMYKGLCPQVDEMGIDYFTVHDSIVVKESQVDEVYDVFEEVLEEHDIITGVAL